MWAVKMGALTAKVVRIWNNCCGSGEVRECCTRACPGQAGEQGAPESFCMLCVSISVHVFLCDCIDVIDCVKLWAKNFMYYQESICTAFTVTEAQCHIEPKVFLLSIKSTYAGEYGNTVA